MGCLASQFIRKYSKAFRQLPLPIFIRFFTLFSYDILRSCHSFPGCPFSSPFLLQKWYWSKAIRFIPHPVGHTDKLTTLLTEVLNSGLALGIVSSQVEISVEGDIGRPIGSAVHPAENLHRDLLGFDLVLRCGGGKSQWQHFQELSTLRAECIKSILQLYILLLLF